MERHCNTLLPAIKSRRYPYESINSFVSATAQLNQIELLYNLDKELYLDPDQKEHDGFIHESCKDSLIPICLIADFPNLIDPLYMLCGPRRLETLLLPMRNKVLACLATRFNVRRNVVQSVVKLDHPMVQYGKVNRLEGGDRMVGRDLVAGTDDSRDASFVRVSLASLLYGQFLNIPVTSTLNL
jgi:hypothetical protein